MADTKMTVKDINALTLTEDETKIITEFQRQVKNNYSASIVTKLVANSISVPKNTGVKVNVWDIITVMKVSASMHLDPTLGGVYAFKNKIGDLITGVSAKGWKQALASQPDYYGCEFIDEPEQEIRLNDRDGQFVVTTIPKTTCIIRKKFADGSIGEFKESCWYKHDCDPNKPAWTTKPEAMMHTRALCRAVSLAYGWGAYDLDEVKTIANNEGGVWQEQQPAQSKGVNRVIQAIATAEPATVDPKQQLLANLKKSITKKEMQNYFKSAPVDLQNDQEVRTLAKELQDKFNKEEL